MLLWFNSSDRIIHPSTVTKYSSTVQPAQTGSQVRISTKARNYSLWGLAIITGLQPHSTLSCLPSVFQMFPTATCPQLPYLCCALPGSVLVPSSARGNPCPSLQEISCSETVGRHKNTVHSGIFLCSWARGQKTSKIHGNSGWARTTEELCCHSSTSIKATAHLFPWAVFSSYNPQPQTAH